MEFNESGMKAGYTAIQTGWLVPVAAKAIKDAVVIIDSGGTIRDFGTRYEIESVYDLTKMPVIRKTEYIVMPALVNSHAHLYYSAFKSRMQNRNEFTGWIERLIELRQTISGEEIEDGIIECAKLMYRRGISLVGNICSEYFRDASIAAGTGLRGINFLEVTDKNYESDQSFDDTVRRIENENASGDSEFISVLSPHAIYSCRTDIIKKISDYNFKHGYPTCMHLAESADETLLVRDGSGSISDFLKNRGIESVFSVNRYESPVQYLDAVRGFNSNFLAVHLLHISDKDLKILAGHKVRAVLCPGANRFLKTGIAPLERLIDTGISISLGTDSAAGNADVDIFREMRILKEEHPSIPAARIIEMATINGAEALGRGGEYGSIEKGKIADLIALPLPDERGIEKVSDVEEYIVTECRGDDVTRLTI